MNDSRPQASPVTYTVTNQATWSASVTYGRAELGNTTNRCVGSLRMVEGLKHLRKVEGVGLRVRRLPMSMLALRRPIARLSLCGIVDGGEM